LSKKKEVWNKNLEAKKNSEITSRSHALDTKFKLTNISALINGCYLAGDKDVVPRTMLPESCLECINSGIVSLNNLSPRYLVLIVQLSISSKKED
jgi:hypothetical protein